MGRPRKPCDDELLARVKRHMHVDHCEDDDQIREELATAVEYLRDVHGVAENWTKTYTKAVYGLVQFWYEGLAPAAAAALTTLINSLKARGEVEM